ncbi:hypothetical protein [Streptomyces sp. NPDC058045]|uniref:hypothetical protein n=1 Tax=Streptomyces sp. NPDC058045 TaxID=3346311 RepID=UPI0036E633DE
MTGSLLEPLLNTTRDQAISLLAGSLATTTTAYARWQLSKRLPARRTWRFSISGRLIMVVSASAHFHTGVYTRPTTGVGQVRAMSLLVPLLTRAYPGIDLEQVNLSSDTPGRDLEADLLTIGGPKTNEITACLLPRIPQLPFRVDGTAIHWGDDTYEGLVQDGHVTSDFGYVVRTVNPFASDRRVVILGGSHTYGTIAAARWLRTHGGARRLPADVAVLVQADVLQGRHVGIPRIVQHKPL